MQPDGERLAPATYSNVADGFSSGWLFPHAEFSPVTPVSSKVAGAPTRPRNLSRSPENRAADEPDRDTAQ
jgi:hypothetical protein